MQKLEIGLTRWTVLTAIDQQMPKTYPVEPDWNVDRKAPELTRSDTDRANTKLSGTMNT